MQLTEDSQPVWVDFLQESSSEIRVSSGVVSKDRERIYFCTTTGLLLQLHGADHPRWENHGRPPGANVSIISDGASIRPGLLLIVSAAGELYEYDQTSKPPLEEARRIKKQRVFGALGCLHFTCTNRPSFHFHLPLD